MTDKELIKAVEWLRSQMVSVATGGALIQHVNEEFQKQYTEVDIELRNRGVNNPISYSNLWDWYGRWSNGDLPTYKSRRQFLGELFNPLLENLRKLTSGIIEKEFIPTGWPRVDRTVGEIRLRLANARNEEQFQAIGLLCREALISLAQAVYIVENHPTVDKTLASKTDAKRMLGAYISVELKGNSQDEARRHAKAALEFALSLQHKRTADFRQAAMCVEATTAVINVIAITSGRRDP
jgi:hypothetical protein